MVVSRDKIFFYILISLIFSLPFLFLPSVFNPYEWPKYVYFVCGSFLLTIFFIFFSPSLSKKHKIDGLTILVLSFLFLVFIADILGIDPRVSILGSKFRYQGFLTLASGIFIFLIARSTVTGKNFSFIGKLAVLTSFSLSLFAFYQWFSITYLHDLSIPTYQGRIVGTMGNPNFLGGYLVVLLPLFLFSDNKKVFLSKDFLLRFITIAMIAGTIILSGSRSAVLGLVAVIIFYLIKFVKIKTETTLLNLLLIFLISLGLFSSAKNHFIREHGSFADNRERIWNDGLTAFVKRPLLGYGQENFEITIPEERTIATDNAHNIFLEVLVSSGIIGLGIFLLIIFAAIKQASYPVKISLVSFLIVAQFNPLSIAQIALFWFLLGISSREI